MSINTKTMSKSELKISFGYASIFAFRMLGLFMIFPVFATLAPTSYLNATPTLIGVALGIYGLTQALLQIPFGLCSDKIGRTPVLLFGLVLFVIGSLIAAQAQSIYVLIIGRCVQGAGAIGSTLLSAISDNTRDSVRNKAMGIVGITIGLSFMVAFILAPIVTNLYGLPGIFYLNCITVIMALLILWLLGKITKDDVASKEHINESNTNSHQPNSLANAQLNSSINSPINSPITSQIKYYFGIFVLHASFAALFLGIPKLLDNFTTIKQNLSGFYAFIFVISGTISMLILHYADKNNKDITSNNTNSNNPNINNPDLRNIKRHHTHSSNTLKLQVGAYVGLIITELLFAFGANNAVLLTTALVLFFCCFNFLESSIPASISKETSRHTKGKSLGIYSSLQFFGVFCGGMLGGILNNKFNFTIVAIFAMVLAILWFIVVVITKDK